MPQVLGIMDVVWRGVPVPIVPDSGKIKLGGAKSTAVTYGRKVGRAETFEPSEIECKTALEKSQSLKALSDTSEGELIVICDTGQTYTFTDAFLVEHLDLNATKGGEITLKWNAGQWQEVVA